MPGGTLGLLLMAVALCWTKVWGQSCVTGSGGVYVRQCCGDTGDATFSVRALKDSLTIVTDGTMPDNSEERLATQNLAKDLVDKFSERGGFETGWVVYAQVTTLKTTLQQLYSTDTCKLYVNGMVWNDGETSNARAVSDGGRWNFGVTNVLVVIVQAESTDKHRGSAAQEWADRARDDGTTVLAIRGARPGVEVSDDYLLGIGGDQQNVFDIADFDQIDGRVEALLAAGDDGKCPPGEATITVKYGLPVVEIKTERGERLAEDEVEFSLSDIGPQFSSFSVELGESCDDLEAGTGLLTSVTYRDEFGNTIDTIDWQVGMTFFGDRGDCGEPPAENLLGCYKDVKNDRIMDTGPVTDEYSMTPALCQGVCAGSTYYGVEYGRDCLCGSSTSDFTKHGESTGCTYECRGDADDTCGGFFAMEVFGEDGTVVPTPAPTTPGVLVGCYKDVEDDRILEDGPITDEYSMTPALCQEMCTGSTYYGVQYGRDCWCGSSTSDFTKHGESTGCRYECRGDAEDTCGGFFAMEVFDGGQ